MTEFKIKVEDELVAALGKEKIEKYISFMIEQLKVKAAAQDVLESLSGTDLVNDPAWKQARNEAWVKYINKAERR
jgi:hypothetical protein